MTDAALVPLPDERSLLGFVERYLAALPGAVGDAVFEESTVGAIGFGVDLRAGQRLAVRRALLPGDEVVLRPLIAYRLSADVAQLLAVIPHPSRKVRAAAADLLRAAVLVSDAKALAWKVKQGEASHGALYDQLNQVLTAIAAGERAVGRLARLEEDAAPGGGELDVLVLCPMGGEPVSVAMSCGRCWWRGSVVGSCSYPVAMGYVEGLRRAGKVLPGA